MLKTYIVKFLDYLNFTLRTGKHTKPIALSKYFIYFFFFCIPFTCVLTSNNVITKKKSDVGDH